MDVALKKKPRNRDHLRLLITKQLETLNLSCLHDDKGKDVDTAALLLSTAALRHSV